MSRLLIIDDDPIVIKLCRVYFTSKGHDVTVAKNGRDGLEKFHRSDFDLVITDLLMPLVHGFRVIDDIKLSVKGKDTPIVLLTADKTEPEMDDYERKRFQDDTITKPFDMPYLARAVQDLLDEL